MGAAGCYVTVEEAQARVLDHVKPGRPITVPLAESLGRTLAEAVRSDLDYPPFDRAMMDGYAVRAGDVKDVPVMLEVIGQIAAGARPPGDLGAGQAFQINTGAPMPPGADAVVPVEHTERAEDGAAVVIQMPTKPGRHVALRASSVSKGTVVLEPGRRMGPCQIGVAGTAGSHRVSVYPEPVVAVLSTGDELVDIDQVPTGPQIRNSNNHVLEALIARAGAHPQGLGSAPDDREQLRAKIREGLQADVLCVTGGISMGEFDFVPGVLQECGVRLLVRKISIKPGRPTIFGVARDGTLVFGLPGNPVSAFIGFWLLVGPALAAMQGRAVDIPRPLAARLKGTLNTAGERRSYAPARIQVDAGGGLAAEPLPWRGSSDPFGMAYADGLIVRPAGSPPAADGDEIRIILIEPL